MTKRKPYWEMTTKELARATKRFDDPNFDPPAVKPTARQLAQLERWNRKKEAAQSTLTLSLDVSLIEHCDQYAADHGLTVSEVVSNALRQLIRKKSA
jgi:hypothetical protein